MRLPVFPGELLAGYNQGLKFIWRNAPFALAGYCAPLMRAGRAQFCLLRKSRADNLRSTGRLNK